MPSKPSTRLQIRQRQAYGGGQGKPLRDRKPLPRHHAFCLRRAGYAGARVAAGARYPGGRKSQAGLAPRPTTRPTAQKTTATPTTVPAVPNNIGINTLDALILETAVDALEIP